MQPPGRGGIRRDRAGAGAPLALRALERHRALQRARGRRRARIACRPTRRTVLDGGVGSAGAERRPLRRLARQRPPTAGDSTACALASSTRARGSTSAASARGMRSTAASRRLRACGCDAGWVNAGGDLRAFGAIDVPVMLRDEHTGGVRPVATLRDGAFATSRFDVDARSRLAGRARASHVSVAAPTAPAGRRADEDRRADRRSASRAAGAARRERGRARSRNRRARPHDAQRAPSRCMATCVDRDHRRRAARRRALVWLPCTTPSATVACRIRPRPG